MPKACDYCNEPLDPKRTKKYMNGTVACFKCWLARVHGDPQKVAMALEKVRAREENEA